jgi:hypothetical protein
MFDEKKLEPVGFIKFGTNRKEYSSYKFLPKTMKMSQKSSMDGIKGKLADLFSPSDIPRDWTKEEIESSPEIVQSQPANPSPIQPASQPVAIQQQPQPLQEVEETPLYTPPSSNNRPQF